MTDVEELDERVDRLYDAVEGLAETVELLAEERQVDEVIENVSTGSRVKSKIKRGTGTRDQEEHTIVGKGADAEEAREEYLENLAAFEEEIADRVRAIQPVEVEEEGEDG